MLNLYDNFNKLKAMKIGQSKYFTWHEALWLPQVSAYAKPSIPEAQNIISVAQYLDAIREHYNKPITVNSWLRPQNYNRIIGGATFSFHRTGLAVDFEVFGVPAETVRNDMKVNKHLVPGCSFENGVPWVHMQVDGKGIFFNPPPKKKGLLDD